MLEVKPLMAELDMKETVMETLLSHLEVCLNIWAHPISGRWRRCREGSD